MKAIELVIERINVDERDDIDPLTEILSGNWLTIIGLILVQYRTDVQKVWSKVMRTSDFKTEKAVSKGKIWKKSFHHLDLPSWFIHTSHPGAWGTADLRMRGQVIFRELGRLRVKR